MGHAVALHLAQHPEEVHQKLSGHLLAQLVEGFRPVFQLAQDVEVRSPPWSVAIGLVLLDSGEIGEHFLDLSGLFEEGVLEVVGELCAEWSSESGCESEDHAYSDEAVVLALVAQYVVGVELINRHAGHCSQCF